MPERPPHRLEEPTVGRALEERDDHHIHALEVTDEAIARHEGLHRNAPFAGLAPVLATCNISDISTLRRSPPGWPPAPDVICQTRTPTFGVLHVR